MTGAQPFMAAPALPGIVIVHAAAGEAALILALLSSAGIPAQSAAAAGEYAAPASATHFLDLTGLSPDAADAMIAAAGSPGPRWVVSAPLDAIDHAAAWVAETGATLLCDPDDADRLAAIQLARYRTTPAALREGGEDVEAQLRQLNEEVARIARVLAELATNRSGGLADRRRDYDGPALDQDAAPARAITAADIRGAIRARRLRERFFPADLFGDPAWDIMLDLLLAEIEHRRVPVSSLCIAAAVPPTTALRWIGQMTDQKLLLREADALDRRRSYVKLSADAGIRLRRLLGVLAAEGLPIP